MANIRVYKMVSGEEVIGVEVSNDDFSYTVKEPASIMMQQQPDGKVGVGIAQFMPYAADKKVVINRAAVAASADPAEAMENEYNRIFGSGLVVPKKPGIITG